jgi:colanic acid biosynthesis glycosyl transferase WcaI
MFDKPLVLWVQDLVVNAAASVGVGKRASRVLEVARRLEQAAVRAADAVVVCSPGFGDYLIDGGAPPSKIETIYNWADVHSIRPIEVDRNGGPVRFLYAGNLGFTQGFDTLVDAARLGGDGVEVQIVGGGNAAQTVRELAAGAPNVAVRDPVAAAAYPELLASADVQVVIQRRIAAGANLPSKIATALASGRPVLASLSAETPAAELLRQSGGAVLVEPESPTALSAAMQALAQDRARRLELGQRGRRYAEANLAKEPALRRLEAAILG